MFAYWLKIGRHIIIEIQENWNDYSHWIRARHGVTSVYLWRIYIYWAPFKRRYFVVYSMEITTRIAEPMKTTYGNDIEKDFWHTMRITHTHIPHSLLIFINIYRAALLKSVVVFFLFSQCSRGCRCCCSFTQSDPVQKHFAQPC